ncbi:hypothetical protein Scep_014123 [Stephania cephalantha]|uniref:DUF3700 domain-containing protein n=1 Tax=Stephania cephalantha TaxID=152367 RepID=A0AAP0J0D3_9MAGN
MLVIEAYKALRDRAPYLPNHVVGHFNGKFAFLVFDKATSTLFVASDQYGKVPLYWGATADGFVAFANDVEILKGVIGKSLATFARARGLPALGYFFYRSGIELPMGSSSP